MRSDAAVSRERPVIVVREDAWYLLPFALILACMLLRWGALVVLSSFIWLAFAVIAKGSTWLGQCLDSVFSCHCPDHDHSDDRDEPKWPHARLIATCLIAPTGLACIGAWNSFHGEDRFQAWSLAALCVLLFVGLVRESTHAAPFDEWRARSPGASILLCSLLAISYGILLQVADSYLDL